MKGVLATRAPGVPVVDVTHAIPAQNVLAGAIVLRHAAPFFPLGSVHVAVIDPGVGGARQALCIETREAFFVGPDNGVLTLAAPPDRRRRVVSLDNDAFHLAPRSRTFHGRDVFAPVAAALASGTELEQLGDRASVTTELVWPAPVRHGDTLEGEVVYVDGFGNLVSNLDAAALEARPWLIAVGEHRVGPLHASYADADVGEIVAVINSWGLLEVAVRDGSATAVLGAGLGTSVRAVDP